jgi:hypothetical protein
MAVSAVTLSTVIGLEVRLHPQDSCPNEVAGNPEEGDVSMTLKMTMPLLNAES